MDHPRYNKFCIVRIDLRGDLKRSIPNACQRDATINWMKRFFLEVPSESAKWSKAAATAVLCLNFLGNESRMTCVSTWLWWFDANITGSSTNSSCEMPLQSHLTRRIHFTRWRQVSRNNLQHRKSGERNCLRIASASGVALVLCAWDVIGVC